MEFLSMGNPQNAGCHLKHSRNSGNAAVERSRERGKVFVLISSDLPWYSPLPSPALAALPAPALNLCEPVREFQTAALNDFGIMAQCCGAAVVDFLRWIKAFDGVHLLSPYGP